jgi:hypothetical protein
MKLDKVAASAPKRSPTPARESSKDLLQQGAAPDTSPPMSSLTHDASLASVKHTPREVSISSAIRSNFSSVSKQTELASATTTPYVHLAYPITNGRLGRTSSAIPPAPYPGIPYTYADPQYTHYTTLTGQRPIAPHPDPARRSTPEPSLPKGEDPPPVLPSSGVPPPPYHYSLES